MAATDSESPHVAYPAAGPEASLRAIHEFPNFDYLRLIAAASVMFSHAFTIAYGNETSEPLVRLLGSTDDITAIYGVCVFFIISGFLITMSAANSRSVVQYVASRVLRIYPALIVCQTSTALILGALFSTAGPIAFVRSLEWARYAYWYSIDVAMSWDIPTVVFYADAKGSGTGLNGSLWTIQQELFCYVVVGLLLLLRLLRWWAVAIIFVLSTPWLFPGVRRVLTWNRNDVEQIMAWLNWSIEDTRLYDYMWVGASFFMGSMIFFLWRRQQRLPAWPLALCAVAFAWAVYRWHFYDYFPFYAAYPLLYIATAQRHRLPSLKRFGDISYGLYLYGWPAEQAVRGWWGPGIAWWQLFGLSLLLAASAAWLSWHVVEKPMLSLKRFFRQKRPEAAPVAAPA